MRVERCPFPESATCLSILLLGLGIAFGRASRGGDVSGRKSDGQESLSSRALEDCLRSRNVPMPPLRRMDSSSATRSSTARTDCCSRCKIKDLGLDETYWQVAWKSRQLEHSCRPSHFCFLLLHLWQATATRALFRHGWH